MCALPPDVKKAAARRHAPITGVTTEELRELTIHVAPYAGFPAAIDAMRRRQALEGAARSA